MFSVLVSRTWMKNIMSTTRTKVPTNCAFNATTWINTPWKCHRNGTKRASSNCCHSPTLHGLVYRNQNTIHVFVMLFTTSHRNICSTKCHYGLVSTSCYSELQAWRKNNKIGMYVWYFLTTSFEVTLWATSTNRSPTVEQSLNQTVEQFPDTSCRLRFIEASSIAWLR